jgi:hypothetical protein
MHGLRADTSIKSLAPALLVQLVQVPHNERDNQWLWVQTTWEHLVLVYLIRESVQ